MKPEDVEWSLNNSLQMLGLSYVDSYLLHWPFVAEKTEENTPKLGRDGKVPYLLLSLYFTSSLTHVTVYHQQRAHRRPLPRLAHNGETLRIR